MKSVSFCVWGLVLAVMAVAAAPTRADNAGVAKLLEAIPGDMPIVLVVTDFESFEKRLDGVANRIDPGAGGSDMLGDIKSELPHLGEWIDFSKPFAAAQVEPGNDDEMVFFGSVTGLDEKVKAVAGASESEGLWKLPLGEGEGASSFYLRTKNDIVIGSTSRTWVDHAHRSETSVGQQLKSRMSLLADRDVLIHFNMEPVRNRALTGLAGVAQMAPMFIMMAGPQAQANPAGFRAVIDSMVAASTKFVEQVEYIDITLGVTADEIKATMATSYNEGPIRSYLSSQRPASMPYFTEIEDQPYVVAMGYHMPGEDAGLIRYMSEEAIKVLKSAQAPQAADGGEGAEGEGGDAAGDAAEAKKAETEELERGIKRVADLYQEMQGANAIFHVGPNGINESGDIITPDAEKFLAGYREVFEMSNEIMSMMGLGGANYKYVGKKEVEGKEVDEYSIKLDANNPAMAPAAAMFKNDTKFLVGESGDRVRFLLGPEEEAPKVFDGKVSKPLASSEFVQKAMKTMPGNPNLVMLVDPANLMPFVAAMTGGGPGMKEIPPGQPIAIGIYLAGQPARMELNVPIQTIERIVKSMSPDEPM